MLLDNIEGATLVDTCLTSFVMLIMSRVGGVLPGITDRNRDGVGSWVIVNNDPNNNPP